jgi:hypothetical protein
MLNDKLYTALYKVFGEPRVVNQGEEAQVELPIPVMTFLGDAVTQVPANSIHRGEQYCVCCPFCGDKRYRLYFSYLWNTNISVGGVTYHCSDRLIRCFNEECQRNPANRQMIQTQLAELLSQDMEVISTPTIGLADSTAGQSLANQVPLPGNLRDIDDPMVPEYVRWYWLGHRKFTPEVLKHFGVKFAYLDRPVRAGASMCQQMVTVIPVYQSGDYWFYQLRLIPISGDVSRGYERDMLGEELPKYIIPHGSRKNWALYNIDNAVNYPTVYIVEGVSDVWRIGDAAVARFGKTLSRAQIVLLKEKLFNKRLVIVPDMDDEQAYDEALRQQVMLKDSGVFTDVLISRLEPGIDPGDLRGNSGEVQACLEQHINLEANNTLSAFGSPDLLF